MLLLKDSILKIPKGEGNATIVAKPEESQENWLWRTTKARLNWISRVSRTLSFKKVIYIFKGYKEPSRCNITPLQIHFLVHLLWVWFWVFMSCAEILKPASLAIATTSSVVVAALRYSWNILTTLTFSWNALSSSQDIRIVAYTAVIATV